MSESLREIMEMNVYDTQKQEWLKGAPETLDAAVYRADGTTVKDALDAIPGAIDGVVAAIKGGVSADGDTLAKLFSKITTMQLLLDSDDIDLDTLQEVVDYIKENRDALELLGGGKVDKDDVTAALDVIAEGKVLDARVGKALKDLIDAIGASVTGLEAQAEGFATKVELQAQADFGAMTYATKSELSDISAGAIPVISDVPPSNPVNGQIWFKPIGSVNV